jgi:ankyrin repeat protein
MAAPSTMRFENIHASGNSRQQNGHHYNNITNNYTTAKSYDSVPVQPPEDPIHSEFIRACCQGQGPQRLGFLLSKGANIDHRDNEQWTPLHHAAASGSTPTLSYLVDVGADILACGERIGTPLHHAASSGSVDAVRYLLDAGAEAHASNDWIGTPLHHAAFSGSTDATRCLLDRGADVNAFNQWVGTPLSAAAARNHLAVVEILLEHDVAINKNCGYFGSAVHMACAAGSTAILRLLHGRKKSVLKPSGRTCYAFYHEILESEQRSLSRSLTFHAQHGENVIEGSPVILAIYHGSVEAAKTCIGLGLKVDMFAWYRQSWYTKDSRRSPSKKERPSMRLAIANLDVGMLQLLLDAGVEPDPDTRFLNPPMFDLGVNKTCKGALDGSNASACISLLIRHGVRNSCLGSDHTQLQPGGETLLMSIMRRDQNDVSYQIAKAVLEHGAPVNASNFNGETAIMIAAGTDQKLRVRCVELLCDFGASVNVEDKNGRTAWRYAEKWGGSEDYVEVKRILQYASEKELDRCLSSSPVKEQPVLPTSLAKKQPLLPSSPVKEQPLLPWLGGWLGSWYG